ncbi:MAG: undecaprenyldiphospho-muramoylpentapeptide beta-N-acetylglucosaminyltransferase [Spirochaetia bacterium]
MAEKIFFTGGGTGGHVYPALAVFDAVKDRWDGKFAWIGSKKGMERSILDKYSGSIEYYSIASGKFRRYFSLKNITDLFLILTGVFQSIAILKRERPVLLFSKGGFVSVPPVIAAKLLGIPAVTHESDFDPGLATKINSRLVRRIYVSYQETAGFFNPALRDITKVTGNPVRPDIHTGRRDSGLGYFGFSGKKPILLILGGSQGSREINSLIAGSLCRLLPVFDIIHQGGDELVSTQKRGEGYFPAAFLGDEYPHAVAVSDIVFARSGAGTLWEISALGKPLLLLPLYSASRGDQVRNAEYFRKRGAAEVLEPNPSPEKVTGVLLKLIQDKEHMSHMSQASRAIGGAEAALLIARDCLTIAGKGDIEQ